MSRLIDAAICPDCRADLDERSACTGCGLVLSGPLATRLWATMVTADDLVERLRSQGAAQTGTPTLGLPELTPPIPAPPRRTRRLLPASSIPAVLLSVGALCLLVAAAVFVAVAWSALGMAGRTTVLLVVTGIFAAVAVLLTRRGLRGSAETFWLTVCAMTTLDLLAAHTAGLAGLAQLSWRGTSAMVGAVILLLGAGAALWARSQPVQRLYGAQGAAVAGMLLVTATNAWSGRNDVSLDVTAAIAVLVLLAGALDHSRLRVASYGVGALALVSWLVLVAEGLDRVAAGTTFSAWWSQVQGWPLLVAAGYAAGATVVGRLARPARVAAATAALASLSLFVTGPANHATSAVLAASAVFGVLSAVSRLAPSVWSPAAGILSVFGLLGSVLTVLVRPLQATAAALHPLQGTAHVGLTRQLGELSSGPASWTAVVVALVALVTGWGALPHVHHDHARRTAQGCCTTAAAGVLGLGLGTYVLGSGPALWLAVVTLTAAGFISAAIAAWLWHDDPRSLTAGALSAYLLVLSVSVASASELLVAVVTTLVALALVAAHALLPRGHAFGWGLSCSGAVGTLVAAYALAHWVIFLGGGRDSQALAVAGLAGLVGVFARGAARGDRSRIALEVSALVAGIAVVALATSVEGAAVVTTVVGTAICLVSVTNRDRQSAGWLAAVVLGIATVLRLVAGVQAPELYTLPAALLLLAFGAWRMVRDEDAHSFSALGSGLTLALLPSLLLSLDEPVSLRGALIGAAGVGVLVVGVARHWSAPFVAGATTTALLALRHLGPVADAVPRWISLGAVGVALLLVGITWEQRRRDVASASRYLTALR